MCPVVHKLSRLLREFKEQFKAAGMRVVKVYLGLPLPHDAASVELPVMRALPLRVDENPWADVAWASDQFGRRANAVYDSFLVGQWPQGVMTASRALLWLRCKH